MALSKEGINLILLKKNHSDSTKKLFIMFAERVFQQTVGIFMGTNYASHLVDMFIY